MLWRRAGSERTAWPSSASSWPSSVITRTPFDGRPRMSQRVSNNGNYIYVYTAGNTIDYYDVTTMKKVRTLTLDTDGKVKAGR